MVRRFAVVLATFGVALLPAGRAHALQMATDRLQLTAAVDCRSAVTKTLTIGYRATFLSRPHPGKVSVTMKFGDHVFYARDLAFASGATQVEAAQDEGVANVSPLLALTVAARVVWNDNFKSETESVSLAQPVCGRSATAPPVVVVSPVASPTPPPASPEASPTAAEPSPGEQMAAATGEPSPNGPAREARATALASSGTFPWSLALFGLGIALLLASAGGWLYLWRRRRQGT